MSNILENVPRTRKDSFNLLDRIITHLQNSGQHRCGPHCHKVNCPQRYPIFDCPKESCASVQVCIVAVSKKWVRPTKTSKKDLQTLRKMKRIVRRKAYRDNVVVFKNSTSHAIRAAVPHLHGQGFLRKAVTVHPYRTMDTFTGGHRVNVYKQGARFDVIDALCNIPVLAGVTRRALKQVVEFSAALAPTVYRGPVRESRP